MKKEYVKPNMLVVELRRRCLLLDTSSRSVKSVGGNADMKYGGSDENYQDEIIK